MIRLLHIWLSNYLDRVNKQILLRIVFRILGPSSNIYQLVMTDVDIISSLEWPSILHDL